MDPTVLDPSLAEEGHSVELRPGSLFRGLRVHSLLGRGAMGSAYLASHPVLRTPVVIKTFQVLSSKEVFREAHLAARVVSPHVVSVLDAGHENGVPFVVQRYVDGIDVEELQNRMLQMGRVLCVSAVCRLMMDAARGLHAIHQVGVVHRDVKPGNLFLSGSGTTMVGDFGVAVDVTKADGSADASGTPLFMAPEQWYSGTLDRRTDIYALGATGHTLAMAQPPFHARTVREMMTAHLQTPYVPPRANSPREAYLFNVFERALRKEAADRFPTAESLAQTVEIIAEKPPVFRRDLGERGNVHASVGHVDIELLQGNLAEIEADVLVNAANTLLSMDLGVADALRVAGGDDIEQAAVISAPVVMGSVVWTHAGKLKAKAMAHAVAALDGAICLQRCVLRTLLDAETKGMKTLAFPALGTGVGEVPMELAAKLTFEAIQTFASLALPNVQRIMIVLWDANALHRFSNVLRSM